MSRAVVFLLCSAACASNAPPPTVDTSDNAIDQLFAGIGTLPVDEPHRIAGMAQPPVADGDYQCVDTPIDEVRRFDQLLGQISVGDVLWPGSMLRGDSVYSGQLTPIALARAPLTFSVSLESLGSGSRSAQLAAPSLSSYRDALGQILAQEISGATPARISAEIEEVSSEQQLAAALGASVNAPLVANVKAGFDFSNQNVHSRFLVKFFQLYYTVDVDPPALPHDFFAPEVTADDVARAIGSEDPPVYVSSIGYGRQVMFTFESELSKSELSAALDFVYQGGPEISGDVSLTHKEVLEHTHTTAFILGGDAGEAAQASIGNFDQLVAFITKGGNYSKDSPGAAIAYKLSYVRDHVPVAISYASQYDERTCSRVTQKLHVVFEKLTVDDAGGDLGNALEMYGDVFAIGSTGTRLPLMQVPRAMFKEIPAGQSFPTTGFVGEAIVPVTPQAGNQLRIETTLFDDQGPILLPNSFGTQVVDAAPFEAGWRRTLHLHRSSGTEQITLQVSMTPVP